MVTDAAGQAVAPPDSPPAQIPGLEAAAAEEEAEPTPPKGAGGTLPPVFPLAPLHAAIEEVEVDAKADALKVSIRGDAAISSNPIPGGGGGC